MFSIKHKTKKAAIIGLALAAVLITGLLTFAPAAAAHNASAGRVGVHTNASAICEGDQFGAYMTIHPPKVYAYNATYGGDLQNVRFRAHIQQYVNGGWLTQNSTNWLVGQATDALPVAFWKNGSNYTQNILQVRIPWRGAWRASVEIYWYPTYYVGSGTDHTVAIHSMPPAAGAYGWCNY